MPLSFLTKIFEGYIVISQEFCRQNKDTLLLTIRILTIINGLQELQLIKSEQTDTKYPFTLTARQIYTIVSQFVITNHLIIPKNQYMLIYLTIIHAFINIVCLCFTLYFKHNKHCQFLVYLFVKIQSLLLIIPTWQCIIYQIQNQPEIYVYIFAVVNQIMYFQLIIWMNTNKQSQLIDFNGIISDDNILIDCLNELLIILAVLLQDYQNQACWTILIVKNLFRILFLPSTLNHNSLFIIIYIMLLITFIVSFALNLEFIFVMPILSLILFLTINVFNTWNKRYLINSILSFQKCQLILQLIDHKKQNSLIKLKIKLLNQQEINHKYLNQSLQLLFQQHQSQQLIKVICNQISIQYPLLSLIQLHKNFENENLISQAYLNVYTNGINKQVKEIQEKQKKRGDLSRLDIKGFILTALESVQNLQLLDQTLKYKINLLEYSRLGVQLQSTSQDSIQIYVKSVWNCKQYIEHKYNIKQYSLQNLEFPDILSLRILQLYFGLLMVSMKKAVEIEKVIDDLLRFDKQFIDSTISNQILLTNRFMILQSSLIHDKEKGQLLNFQKEQASSFFKCSNEQISNYKRIYEFMPDFIALIHDDLVNQYIQRGTSKLMEKGTLSFMKTPLNYILPAYIHLFNPLFINDVTLFSVFTQMNQYFDYVIFDTDGIIQGITQKFFEFMKYQLNEQNQKYMNVEDLVDKGGYILSYMPYMIQYLQQLRLAIINSQNYQLSNLRSIWEQPSNMQEHILQTQFLISQFKQQKKKIQSNQNLDEEIINQDYFIDNIHVNLLDQTFQFQIMNQANTKSTQRNLGLGQRIEISYSLLAHKIANNLLFMLQIQDFRLTDAATTTIASSNNKSNTKTISLSTLPQVDILESEQISSEGHQIQDIQIFNDVHQKLLVEKLLYDDFEIDNDGIIDKNSSKQINFSQNQSKAPFIITQRQTHRQLLSGTNTNRQTIQRTEFVLPQLAIQENTNRDYDMLNQLEREMVEITKNKSQLQDHYDEVKLDNDGDFLSKSLDTSNNQDEKTKITLQKLASQQLETIRDIIDNNNNIKIVYQAYILTCFVEIVVILGIIIICIILSTQFDLYHNALTSLQKLQSLNNIVTSTYLMTNSKYLIGLGITYYSQQLKNDLNTSLYNTFNQSINQQLNLEIESCFLSDSSDKEFENCFVQYNQFQKSMLDYYRYGILNENYNYTNLTVPTVFQQNIYTFINFFLTQTQDLIDNHTDKSLNDGFIIMLVICLVLIVFIYILLFRSIKQKITIKIKLISLLHRLTQDEIIEQIASYTIIMDSWKSQQWKQYNFYDLQKPKTRSLVKEVSTAKTSQRKNQYQQKHVQNVKEKLLIIVSSFNLILLISFFICGYVYLLSLYYTYLPSININQQFMQFQLKMDTSITLGSIIKAEAYMYTFRNQSEQSSIIQTYFKLVEAMPTLIADVVNQIMQYQAVDQQTINEILNQMNSDFCVLYSLPFCSINTQGVEQFSNESYKDFLQSGLSGMAAYIYQFSVTDFEYEKSNQLFISDKYSLLQTIHEQLFTNIFVQYILDIGDVLDQTQTLILDGNKKSGDMITEKLYLYYIICGLLIMLFIIIVNTIMIQKAKIEICQDKFLLLMIPEYKVDNSVIKQKIINISTYFN